VRHGLEIRGREPGPKRVITLMSEGEAVKQWVEGVRTAAESIRGVTSLSVEEKGSL